MLKVLGKGTFGKVSHLLFCGVGFVRVRVERERGRSVSIILIWCCLCVCPFV